MNGALPGIIMPGHPQVGDQYRQEYAKGVAEDTGEVLSLTGSETTPLTGPVSDLLVTKDSDLLDPTSPPENKYYARGIGLILTTEPGGARRSRQGREVLTRPVDSREAHRMRPLPITCALLARHGARHVSLLVECLRDEHEGTPLLRVWCRANAGPGPTGRARSLLACSESSRSVS